MKALILSDIHVEAAPFTPETVDCDIVMLAGDIGNGVASLAWARKAFANTPIVFVAGNHEFYGGEYFDTLAKMRQWATRHQVGFLECNELRLDSARGAVRILGCTLWTDFAFYALAGYGPVMNTAQAALAAQGLMADYRAISFKAPDGEFELFAPQHAIAIHETSRQWLNARLDEPFAGTTVVMTHHLPTARSVAPAFRTSMTNPAFASHLDGLVAKADVWIHGHTHVSSDYAIGGTRIICNPRGYPRRHGGFENAAFDPSMVVSLN